MEQHKKGLLLSMGSGVWRTLHISGISTYPARPRSHPRRISGVPLYSQFSSCRVRDPTVHIPNNRIVQNYYSSVITGWWHLRLEDGTNTRKAWKEAPGPLDVSSLFLIYSLEQTLNCLANRHPSWFTDRLLISWLFYFYPRAYGSIIKHLIIFLDQFSIARYTHEILYLWTSLWCTTSLCRYVTESENLMWFFFFFSLCWFIIHHQNIYCGLGFDTIQTNMQLY